MAHKGVEADLGRVGIMGGMRVIFWLWVGLSKEYIKRSIGFWVFANNEQMKCSFATVTGNILIVAIVT
jgi:hypothetical protein